MTDVEQPVTRESSPIAEALNDHARVLVDFEQAVRLEVRAQVLAEVACHLDDMSPDGSLTARLFSRMHVPGEVRA